MKELPIKSTRVTEDDGFTVNIRFPKVSQLQTNLSIRTRMTSLLEEKTFSETRRRRSDGAWGTVCKWFNTDDWGWEDYSVTVTPQRGGYS